MSENEGEKKLRPGARAVVIVNGTTIPHPIISYWAPTGKHPYWTLRGEGFEIHASGNISLMLEEGGEDGNQEASSVG